MTPQSGHTCDVFYIVKAISGSFHASDCSGIVESESDDGFASGSHLLSSAGVKKTPHVDVLKVPIEDAPEVRPP